MHLEKERFGYSGFLLKILAFAFMTSDHLGYCLQMSSSTYQVGMVLRYIGRLAFPLFMFFLAEGMNKSRRKERYLFRLGLMWAMITGIETIGVYVPFFSQQFDITPASLPQEPFTDLILNGALLYCLTLKKQKKLFALIPLAIICLSFGCDVAEWNGPYVSAFPIYLRAGYGLVGPLLVLSFFYGPRIIQWFKKKKNLTIPSSRQELLLSNGLGCLFFALSFFALYCTILVLAPTSTGAGAMNWLRWEVYSLLAIPFVLLYNGERGYDAPWWRFFSYFFFLIHIGILALIFFVF